MLVIHNDPDRTTRQVVERFANRFEEIHHHESRAERLETLRGKKSDLYK